MSNNTANLISFDEVIRLSRLKGVDFGKGDPYNRLRYYIKIGLLPKATRKSFNGLAPAGALPFEAVDQMVEINEKIKSGKTIQTILRESKGVADHSAVSVTPILISENTSSFPATEDSKSTDITDFGSKTVTDDLTPLTSSDTSAVAGFSLAALLSKHNLSRPKAAVVGFEILLLAFGLVYITSLIGRNVSEDNKGSQNIVDRSNLPSILGDQSGETLASTISDGLVSINVPTNISGLLTSSSGIVTNNTDIDAGTGKLTASNVIYSLTAGSNVSISGGQNAVISVGNVAANVNGTANRITVNGSNIDIASNYSGQSSITTLGTITSGTWQGGVITDTYISDNITVSGYLPLTGGTLSGPLTLSLGPCNGANVLETNGSGQIVCGTDDTGAGSPITVTQNGGGGFFADQIDFNADFAVTNNAPIADVELNTTGVSANSYGSASSVATFTVDTKGRLTTAGTTPIAIAATAITSGTLNDARLSTNVTLQGNSFNGANQLVQLNGSTQLPAVSGALLTNLNASNISSGTLAVARGGTGADLSATGGANQFVRQNSVGGAFTVSTIGDADIPDTITLTNITQITNRAISDTTGTLAINRGGTNNTSIGSAGSVAYSTGTAYAFTAVAGSAGLCLQSDNPTSNSPVWGACGGIAGITIRETDLGTSVAAATTIEFGVAGSGTDHFDVFDNAGVGQVRLGTKVVLTDASQTLSNKTIAAGSNTISGLTNSNLSGTAGITNANLANSSITINNGTGISGGAVVSLGGSVTITNTGVISVSCTTITCSGTNPASFSIADGAIGFAKLATLTSGNILVGNGSNIASSVAMSGDVFISNAGLTTIQPDSVALGTDTSGNYVAGATSNAGLIMSGTEGGTLGITLASAGDDNAASFSGLTLSTSGGGNGLSLLVCSNGQILKRNGSNQWVCGSDNTGAGSASVSLRTTPVVGALAILDFNDEVFNVTEPVGDTADVSFRLGTTGGSSSATFSGLQKISGGSGGLSLLSCSNGQILKKVTGNWACSADAGGGGGGSGQTLDETYQNGNSIDINNTYGNLVLNLADATNDNNIVIDNTTTGDVATALLFATSGSGATIGTAIDLSDSDIGTALALGNNDVIVGGATISSTEFARLDGKDAALVDTNDAVATAITGTGTLTAGATGAGFTINLSASTISGVLAVTNGGTGVSSFGGTNTLLYTSAANTLTSLAANAGAVQCLTQASSNAPTWGSCGAGASNSFETIAVPAGSSPVASSPTDTLTLALTGTNLTITGNSGTDTITFDIVESVLAGNGLGVSGDGLVVNAGTGISISGDNVTVDQSFSPTWTGVHTFTPSGTNDLAINLDADSTLIKTFSSGTNNTSGETYSVTNSSVSGTVAVNGSTITLVGTNTSGTNTITGINFADATTATNNTINGITFGTGFNNFLTSGTINISAAGAITGATGVSSSGTITFSGLSTGVVISSSGTLSAEAQLANSRGGTGQNSAGWTGVPSVSSGTWSVNTLLPISLGGTNSSATPTSGGIAYGTGTAYSFTSSGTGSQCLLGGATPSFGSCGAGAAGQTYTDGSNTVNGATALTFQSFFTVGGTTPNATVTITNNSLDFAQLQDTLDLDTNLTLNQDAFTWTQNYSPAGTTATATGMTFVPTFGIDATDQTLTGISIAPNTNSNTDSGDTLIGLNLANITATNATETAINIGTGWDNALSSISDSRIRIGSSSDSGLTWLLLGYPNSSILTEINYGTMLAHNSGGAFIYSAGIWSPNNTTSNAYYGLVSEPFFQPGNGAHTYSKFSAITAIANVFKSTSTTLTNAIGLEAGVSAPAGQGTGTLTNSIALYARTSGQTATNAYGVYIQNQNSSSTNDYGIYIEDADTGSLVLASNDGDAASGITFGTTGTVNLYRSAADTLRTDDAFTVNGNFSVSTAGSATLATGQFIGLGSGAGRFVFADATPDTITVSNAQFVLSNTSGEGVSGANLSACNATTEKLLWNATGLFSCGTDGGSSGTVKLNSILAADNTNTINSANFAQVWNWNTLTTQRALTLGSGSTPSALTSGGLLAIGDTDTLYTHSSGTTGSLATITFRDTTSAAVTSTTNGLLVSPTVNITAGTATKTINGISINPTFTACTTATCNVNALNIASVTDSGNFNSRAINIGTGWDFGLTAAAGGTAAINLTSTAGTAAGGILFGSDTTLYRAAAGELETDGTFSAAEGLLSGGGGPIKLTNTSLTGAPTRTAFIQMDECGGNPGGIAFDRRGNEDRYYFTVCGASPFTIFEAGIARNPNYGSTDSIFKIYGTTPADTSGTQIHNILQISTPTIGNATGGTNTVNLISTDDITGDAQVTLNALNIGALTGTAATETAINIGAGWDMSVMLPNSGAIGLGTSAGRFVFADATPDTITVNDARFVLSGTSGEGVSGAGLTACNATTEKLLWNATGLFSCGTDQGSDGVRLDQILAANTSDTDNDSLNNNISWNWSTLTTQRAFTLNSTATAMTTGGILAIGNSSTTAYTHTSSETGSLVTIDFADTSSLAAFTSTTNGLLISPEVNTTGGGTKTINAVSINPTFTGCATGSCNFNGLNFATTSDTANLTSNAININASGWDTGIKVNGFTTSSQQLALDISGYSLTNGSGRVAVASLAFTDASSSGNSVHIDSGLLIQPTLAMTTLETATTGEGRQTNGLWVQPQTTTNGCTNGGTPGICSSNGVLSGNPLISYTNNTTSTVNINAFSASPYTFLSQDTAAGTTNYRGLYVPLPVLSHGAGTLNADGVRVVIPSTAAITGTASINGLNVIAPTTSGPSTGSITGLNIGAFTSAGNSVDTAINIGTGWDTAIQMTGANTIGTTGATTWSSTQTSGTILNLSPTTNVTVGGNLTGVGIDFQTFYCSGTCPNFANRNTIGTAILLPDAFTNTSGTRVLTGHSISTAGLGNLVTNGATTTFSGLSVTNPNITGTSGTIAAHSANITLGTITTAGTQNGANIIIPSGTGSITTAGTINGVNIPLVTTGPSVGTINGFNFGGFTTTTSGGSVNAINIGNIGTSGGTDTAINIGTGWDNLINSSVFGVNSIGEITVASNRGLDCTTSSCNLNIGQSNAKVITLGNDGNGPATINLGDPDNNEITTINVGVAGTGTIGGTVNISTGNFSNFFPATLNIAVTNSNGGPTVNFANGSPTANQTVNIGSTDSELILNLRAGGVSSVIDYTNFDVFANSSNNGVLRLTSPAISSGTVSIADIIGVTPSGTSTQNFICLGQSTNCGAITGGTGATNGINIANITGGTGIEKAINIGTGWDNSINGVGTLGLSSSLTTGTAIRIGQGVATTLSGAYTGLSVDLNTNFTPGSNNRTGISIASVTSGGSAETAFSIGSGWDTYISLPFGSIQEGLFSSFQINSTGAAGFFSTSLGNQLFRIDTDDTSDIGGINYFMIQANSGNVERFKLDEYGTTVFTHGLNSNVGGTALTINPSFTGGATDALTYNAFAIAAFSPTNSAGTDTVNGISIGALTDPGATITSTGINIASGWDTQIKSVGLSSTHGFSVGNISSQFGALAESGAFLSHNSYFKEEWNIPESGSTTADTAYVWGDHNTWHLDENTDNCTWSTPEDTINGVGQVDIATNVHACLAFLGGSSTVTNADLKFDADNLPVILAKVRVNHVNNQTTAVGLWDNTTADTSVPPNPTNGIFAYMTNGNWIGRVDTSVSSGTSNTGNCVAATANAFALIKIVVVSTSLVEFYIDPDVSNGISFTKCTNLTTNIPTAGMTSFFNVSSASTNQIAMIDFIRIWQDDALTTESEEIIEENTDGATQQAYSSPVRFGRLIGSQSQLNALNAISSDEYDNITATLSAGTSFNFVDAFGNVVARISDTGEAVFNSIQVMIGRIGNLIIGDRLAIKKDADIAGIAKFEVDQSEVFIETTKVTEESLVYVTAKTKTAGLNLFVKEVRPGEGFVVALEKGSESEATQSATRAIEFNWLIVDQEN